MDWTTPLRSLQADFIKRLESDAAILHHVIKYQLTGYHSELIVVSGEELDEIRKYCWYIADKYKKISKKTVYDDFINNLKGKLGEIVVKKYLGDFVTPIDLKERAYGDGKIDFKLTSDPSIDIQVKARHARIDTVKWSVNSEEVEKNAVLVCIYIQEEVSEAQPEYNLILAGFLPTNMMKVSNGKASVGINELLYGGGLKAYLEFLQSERHTSNSQFNQQKHEQIFVNCSSWKCLHTLTGHSEAVNSVAISPNGQILASSGIDNTIKIWHLGNGKLIRTLDGHHNGCASVAFSPDGQTLASGSADDSVQIWHLDTGKLIRTLTSHSSYVTSVAFSPDGQTLVSGSWDKTVKIWHLDTGKLIHTLTAHSDSVSSVAFSPGGQTLVSASGDEIPMGNGRDNTIKVWCRG